MQVNRAAENADARMDAMLATNMAEAETDATTQDAVQSQSMAALQNDTSDESELVASLKKFNVMDDKKDTKRLEKVANAQESVLVRKDESADLAADFSKKNKEYHLDTDSLTKIAEDLEDLMKNPDVSEEDIIYFITSRTSTKPTGEMTQAESRMIAGQNDKIFDFLVALTERKIEGLSAGREKPSPSQLKPLNDFKAKISSAKELYYGNNKEAITDVRKLIALGDLLVQGKPEKEARSQIGQKIDDLHTMMHNPPEFTSYFNEYVQLGKNVAVDIDKIYADTSDILEKIGPKLKDSNLERAEISNVMKGVRVYQASRTLCHNAEKQMEQMDRMGVAIPENINSGKLAALFYKLTAQPRTSPDMIRKQVVEMLKTGG
jgi:hypothetical protein